MLTTIEIVDCFLRGHNGNKALLATNCESKCVIGTTYYYPHFGGHWEFSLGKDCNIRKKREHESFDIAREMLDVLNSEYAPRLQWGTHASQ